MELPYILINFRLESNTMLMEILKDVDNRKKWFDYHVLQSGKNIKFRNLFLFFNKPRGLACHDGEKLDYNLIKLLRVCGHTNAVPIHRLDKDTTGILIIALSTFAKKCGAEWFAKGSIKKYVSISDVVYFQGTKCLSFNNSIGL